MTITTETCGFCKGRKHVERLEEMRADGWYTNTMLPLDFAESWIAADRYAPVRFAECLCPSCGGRGEYEVEHFTCKIF